MGRADASAARAVRPTVVLLGVLVLAVNLRAALAAYPPLLETVRADLGIDAGAAGLVQAGAVLMMALGSFFGPILGARFGRKPALGGAVGLVALGSAVRGVPVAVALVGGSVLVGLGIGVAGVLLTGVVKNHLGARAGAATGAYVVAMMVGAIISSLSRCRWPSRWAAGRSPSPCGRCPRCSRSRCGRRSHAASAGRTPRSRGAACPCAPGSLG